MSSINDGLFVNGSSFEDKYGTARLASVIYLCAVGVCGIIANCLVIFVFWKYPKLRTAANLFILNLAFCDVMLSIFDNTFSIASTLYGRWLFGRACCVAYGFFYYFFICCTVSTLAVISVDRFFFITRPSQTRAVQVITKRKAIGILLIIYLYTLLFTFPPCVGWNSFVEEKVFYSGCYINYGDQRTSSIVYSVIAPFFLFLVPLSVMIFCYARIFVAVRRSTQRTIGRSLGTPNSVKKRYPVLKRTHIQTAKMIIVVIFFSMIVWVPYVVVSFIKASNGYIDPLVSHITVLVAKSCVIYNVLIYVMLNRKLKAVILDAVCCGRQSFSLIGSPSSGNNANRNRISRILSETEVPSQVAGTQRNRLSALTLQRSNEKILEEFSDHLSPPFIPKVKNGVVKSVEFKDGQRRDTVIGPSKEELEEVINGRGTTPAEVNGGPFYHVEDFYVRRKKVSKVERSSDGNRMSNGSLISSPDGVSDQNNSQQGTSEKSTPLNATDVTSPCYGTLPVERTQHSTYATSETPLCTLPREKVGLNVQRVHHLYSSSTNSRSQNLSSPSQMYKKGTRPASAQRVTKRESPGSTIPRASTCTDQESDLSRTSREGSFAQRSVSNLHKTKKLRSGNRRKNGKNTLPSRMKSHVSYGRRDHISNKDPLQTSAQELMEIQNFWKRMSLCLDDIDLDEVTREMEMV
ncbi:melanopsin-like [Stylophora pistillata]|uniref:melanopsin-like n=1 Tax=Stylophora pistillata TaxID=50429 RepID=UPI000C04D4DB|nr:melanopsin-like [Stylophora pistillata]